jgi:peptidoglycan/LPS O-acetylase OafA/YrhL
MKKIHFVGLNELRAIAALAVLFYHIELYKKRDHIYSLYDTFIGKFVESMGHNGVNLFFVLSGFLITYLLIEEKEKNSKIDIKKFYVRRILRIWPLYYFIMFLSFVILPFAVDNFDILKGVGYYNNRIQAIGENIWLKLLLFLFFIPNVALALRISVAGASQSWSVGTEEQYYLFWPIVIDKIKKSNWLKFFLFFIFAKISLDIFLFLMKSKGLYVIYLFSRVFGIEMMAVGAIGAYYTYYYFEQTKKIANNNIYAIISYILIIVCLYIETHHMLIAPLFLFVILATVNNATFTIKNKVLDDLGKISYGIYMYHPIIVFFSFSIVNKYVTNQNLWLYNICLYSLIIGVTVLVSKLSYKYFESYFLKLKSKGYTVIESGS